MNINIKVLILMLYWGVADCYTPDIYYFVIKIYFKGHNGGNDFIFSDMP